MIAPTALLVGLGILPSMVWVIFFRHEDDHPEPSRLIIFTFLAGAAITFAVLFIQRLINSALHASLISQYNPLALFLFALVEESGKFAAAGFIVWTHRRDFEEPIDAMIYMLVAAFGLAAVENVALALRATDTVFIGGGALEVVGLRFFGATLLHGIASGIVGYFWGRAVFLRKNLFAALSTGILVATLLHAFFNYLILISEPVKWPLVLLMAVAPFLFYDFSRLRRTANR